MWPNILTALFATYATPMACLALFSSSSDRNPARPRPPDFYLIRSTGRLCLRLAYRSTMPMPPVAEPAIEDGQFDDAPEELAGLPSSQQHVQSNVRDGHSYVDEAVLEWSDESPEEEDTEDEEGSDEFNRVEDEDWEIAEKGAFALLFLLI